MFQTIQKMKVRDEKGFTLIELLIVVAIIGILAAIAIPGYLGMQERSKKGAAIRAASASEPELQAWLNSTLKSGPGASLRENDTDGNGSINASDEDNVTLSTGGVCSQYITAQTNRAISSPWGGKLLWSVSSGAGQIECIGAAGATAISITARDNSNTIIHFKTMYSD